MAKYLKRQLRNAKKKIQNNARIEYLTVAQTNE